MCGCQYWRDDSGFRKRLDFCNFFLSDAEASDVKVGSRLTGGSGWVAVISFDRGDRCGSNGAGYSLWQWLLAGWQLNLSRSGYILPLKIKIPPNNAHFSDPKSPKNHPKMPNFAHEPHQNALNNPTFHPKCVKNAEFRP
jgi:hypothetical protein